MLVISNGAGKCGSTWLASIIISLVQPKPLPPGYQDERHVLPTIKPQLLRKFLNEADYAHANYVSKNGFFYERRLLSRYRHVYVIDIERDMCDTMVSLFFHATYGQPAADPAAMRRAYWEFGPDIVQYIARYHAVWRKKSSWTYTASYERLSANPRQEIAAIAGFLGLRLTAERLETVIRETGFKNLAEKLSGDAGMKKRFRKGVVGDHRNHLDADVIADIQRIEAANRGFPRTLAEKVRFAIDCARHAGRNAPPTYRKKMVQPGTRPSMDDVLAGP